MDETINDAARRLLEYGIELCNSNNSRADIRNELQHAAATTTPSEWRERVLRITMEQLTTNPAWLAVPEDALSLSATLPQEPSETGTTSLQAAQGDLMQEHIRRLVEAQVRAYIEQHQAATEHNATPPTPTPPSSSTAAYAKKRVKLPDVGKFNGNRRAYRTFKSQMTDKLKSLEDQSEFGVAYMFNRLEGQAAHVGLSWKDRNPNGTTTEFWAFLDEQYKDSLFEERSRQKLQTVTMKRYNQSLEAFNAEFIQLAYDAAEEKNTRNLKTRYMSAIRGDLQEKMVSVDVPEDWDLQDLMARVLKIDVNMRRTRTQNNSASFGRQHKRTNNDEMDWEPTKTHAGQIESNDRRRAEWVSQDVIDGRRANKQCLRCGKNNHYVSQCRLGPARRPDNIQAKAVAAVEATEGTCDSDNSDSEN